MIILYCFHICIASFICDEYVRPKYILQLPYHYYNIYISNVTPR